jgi:Domain of unknown function (DUF4145)
LGPRWLSEVGEPRPSGRWKQRPTYPLEFQYLFVRSSPAVVQKSRLSENALNQSEDESMKIGANWKCPYCGHAQVIADERRDAHLSRLYVENWVEGKCGYHIDALVCANVECRKLSVEFAIVRREKDMPNTSRFGVAGTFQHWRLLPSSFAKPLPDYIPEPLRRDYEEACTIRDLSPKASATLIRRCIQGIIRDFCGIGKKRLIDEIKELRQRITARSPPCKNQDLCIETNELISFVLSCA